MQDVRKIIAGAWHSGIMPPTPRHNRHNLQYQMHILQTLPFAADPVAREAPPRCLVRIGNLLAFIVFRKFLLRTQIIPVGRSVSAGQL